MKTKKYYNYKQDLREHILSHSWTVPDFKIQAKAVLNSRRHDYITYRNFVLYTINVARINLSK